jgi:hypothetical protein
MKTIPPHPTWLRSEAKGERGKAKVHQLLLSFSPLTTLLTILILLFFTVPSSLAQEEGTAESWLAKVPLTGCLKLAPDGTGCAEPRILTHPAPISWENLQERLPMQKRIPPALPEDLRYRTGVVSKKEIVTIDLSSQVPQWLSLDFRTPQYKASEQWVQSVGNLLQAFSAYRKNEMAQKDALEKLRKGYPLIWEEVKDFLPEWIQDAFLYTPQWDPYKTGSAKDAENDGMLERPPFLLRAGVAREGFVSPDKDRKIFQACAPIYAPLDTILAVEGGFQDYPKQVGSNYREVYPLEGTFFTGKDPGGNPFVIYDVSFKQKPFPPLILHYVLRQFIHYEGNRWIMHNHLLSGDMNYLRLKISYDPITTTEGQVIGYVKTELMEVDIKILPMGDKDRIAGVRGDVGNIKLASEAKAEKPQ